MTTEQIDTFAAEIAADFAEEVQAADTLLTEIVTANRSPNYSELVYFAKRLNWDERAVKNELRRIGSVLRDRTIAGSSADRQAAIAEAATASKVLESEGPKLSQKIIEVQSKLTSLDRDARLSTKRVEDQSLAVERLRGLCPQHIRDAVNHRRNLLEHALMRQIHDVNTRIAGLSCVLNRDRYPAGQSGEIFYLESVQRCVWEAVHDVGQNGFRKLALSPAWPSIRGKLETELAELQAKLEPLQQQYDSELAKIECGLDYYLAPQPE